MYNKYYDYITWSSEPTHTLLYYSVNHSGSFVQCVSTLVLTTVGI